MDITFLFKNLLHWIVGENKIVELEEELRQIGENLKVLEVAEEKAQRREEDFKRQLRVLNDRLKTAESRLQSSWPLLIFQN